MGLDIGTKPSQPVVTDVAFSVEKHGVDLIPDAERHGSPFELFWVWLGANIIFTDIIVGAVIVTFGLGFWPSLLAIFVGNLFLVFVGLGAISGPRTGTATLAASRSAFGIFGNIPAAFLSWITLVGWEAVYLVIGTLALYQLAIGVHVPGGTATKAVCLAITMLVTFSMALLGHQTIVVLQRWFAVALGVGTLVLAGFVIPKTHLHYATAPLAASTPFTSWLLALLVVAAGALSYANYGADYSRYLPRRTRPRSVVLWTTLGCFVPLMFINYLGLAAATATNMSNEVAGIERLVPGWFGTLYLAIIVGGGITNNFLNCYSSGLSLLSTGIKMPRTRSVLLDAVIGGGMAVYAVFVYNFTNSFIEFLSLMVAWLAPWCAIYLTDMLMRRARYSPKDLFARNGAYWYSRGWNWRAIAAFVLGIVGALLFANAPLYQGPLIGLIGNGDISIYVGFVVAAVTYYLLMRGTIRIQAAEAARLAVAQSAAAAAQDGAPEVEGTAR